MGETAFYGWFIETYRVFTEQPDIGAYLFRRRIVAIGYCWVM
jgi:hypothetical protein